MSGGLPDRDLACAFLATLCPDHPIAALHSLAGLLAPHGHRGSGAALWGPAGRPLPAEPGVAADPTPWPGSCPEHRCTPGVADYLQAFVESADQTVAFIHTHQQPYTSLLWSEPSQDYISEHQEAGDGASQQVTNCQRLLVALDPGGIWSITLSPEALLQLAGMRTAGQPAAGPWRAAPAGRRPQGRACPPPTGDEVTSCSCCLASLRG